MWEERHEKKQKDRKEKKLRSMKRQANHMIINMLSEVGEKKWGNKFLIFPNFTIDCSDYCWELKGKSGPDDSFTVTLNQDDDHYFFEVGCNNDKSCTNDTSKKCLREALKEILMKEFDS